MTPPVEAVLFDIDDTLCEYRRTGADVLSVAFDRAGVDPFFTVEEYVDRYREFTDESEDIRDLRERCFSTFATEQGLDPDVGRAVADFYADERDHTNVAVRDGVRETLDRLHGKLPLAVVTNGSPEMQSVKLNALGLTDRFETIVHAGYDAPAKPAPEPFHVALDRLETLPERAVHVGNSLASDVAGAHAAGLRSVWLANGTANPDPEPHYVLDSMRDLTEPPWR